MAEQIAPFMSYDDWNDLGPIGRAQPKDDEIYDGTTRPQINEPLWARLKMGGPNKILGNPNHDYKADAFTSAHSQYFHFMNTLDKGGKEALALVREAAKQGDRVTQDAERIGGHPKAWTMVASDTGSAQVLRAFVETSLDFFPAAKGVHSQKLPKEITPELGAAIATSFHEKANLKRFRARAVKNGKVAMTNEGKTHAGCIAVYADKGAEQAALKWINEQSDRLMLAVGPSAPLWQALIEEGKNGGSRHYRHKFYGAKEKDGQAMEAVVRNADAAVCFVSHDPRSKGHQFLATAARAGKAAKVFDDHGQDMPLYATAREAMDANMSKKEFAQSRTLAAFELPANEPNGRLALSFVRNDKAAIDANDIVKLAMTEEPINLLSDMAKTEQGKEWLFSRQISASTVKLLGDEKVMSNAREKYLRINKQMAENGTRVIGAEEFPKTLQASRNAPPFLFAQGNVDLLREADNIVGVIGQPVKDTQSVAYRMTMSRSAPAVSALVEADVTIARVEDTTSVRVPVTGQQILVIGTGHGHVHSDAAKADREAVLASGGVILSHLPPEESSSFFNPETKKREGVLSTGNDLTTNKAATLLGQMATTVLVTEMDASDHRSPVQAAVLAQLKEDRRPTVVNQNDTEGFSEVSGNRAMLMSRGARALQRAGFGNDVIETMGADLGDSRIAIDLGRDAQRGIRNLAHMVNGRHDQMDLPEASAQRGRGVEENY